MITTQRAGESGPVSAVQFIDRELVLSNAGPTEVGFFLIEAGKMYVIHGEVYGDDGADPTFSYYDLIVGNGVAGNFTEYPIIGALNFSVVAASGTPGNCPINMQTLGPAPVKVRITFTVTHVFNYTDV